MCGAYVGVGLSSHISFGKPIFAYSKLAQDLLCCKMGSGFSATHIIGMSGAPELTDVFSQLSQFFNMNI